MDPNASSRLPTVNVLDKLSQVNEASWLQLGLMWESLSENKKAQICFENTLKHNPYNTTALTQAASLYRLQEQYEQAIQYFNRIVELDHQNVEVWGALGHCYLMMEDLPKAYHAYQQALSHLLNPKNPYTSDRDVDPNLWYGIGILYDRYGFYDYAEEAFRAVLKYPNFEKKNEAYFRLGIIYKSQQKYEQSTDCFRQILENPPRSLVPGDIWFQIGHSYELQREYEKAKDAYERVLKDSPNHAKVLQQLGWLYHHYKDQNLGLGNQDLAISYLMRSLEADKNEGQTWYLLGRCYMTQQQFKKAYDAYQQAIYRDSKNPTFWCSVGVLFYQIHQYDDALDAYKIAIRLNPYRSEVWFDLGTLYESCNQFNDSLDAYQRASELDPNSTNISEKLALMRQAQKKHSLNTAGDVEMRSSERKRTRLNDSAGKLKDKDKDRESERELLKLSSKSANFTNDTESTQVAVNPSVTSSQNTTSPDKESSDDTPGSTESREMIVENTKKRSEEELQVKKSEPTTVTVNPSNVDEEVNSPDASNNEAMDISQRTEKNTEDQNGISVPSSASKEITSSTEEK
eukprot:TRINITY_DN6374_c0_g1_i1.p1 TRINITY_DN6374_c0_g1~~TRINITY_DN6374_c0_g1_i1.p1  ORF type:complete len:572 (+),score=104.28 TRINITY_DN6374_c0_g1_i1:99-1814(+)